MRSRRGWLRMMLAVVLLLWAVALGLRHWGASAGVVEIHVGSCAVVTERPRLDASTLRLPADVDRHTTAALLHAFRRDSRHLEQGGDWILRGRIDMAAAQALQQRLQRAPAPEVLRITSFGGNERAAIAMADLIATHRLPVIVDTVCASACANYLLPAAPRVLVDGLVLMHGSPASCEARLGFAGAVRELGWRGFLFLREAARRQRDFEQRHPGFQALVERSAPPHRGDPAGIAHDWRSVPRAELAAAHAGALFGNGHARAAAAYRTLLQSEPRLGSAYFP